jgi:hypothetical protein
MQSADEVIEHPHHSNKGGAPSASTSGLAR